MERKSNLHELRKEKRKYLILSLIFIPIAIFFYVRTENQKTNEAKRTYESIEQTNEAFRLLKELEKYKQTDKRSFAYRGYYVWQSGYDDKYYIASWAKPYKDETEAKKAIDGLYHLQKEYLQQLENYWKAYQENSGLFWGKLPERPRSHDGLKNQYVSYLEKGDSNGDKKLDWGEIKRFQVNVFENFRYENNSTVFTPKQFFLNRGGDCDDFAVFSASFTEFYGYSAYVLVIDDYDGRGDHAVAAVYIGQETYGEGYVSIRNRNLYDPKHNQELNSKAPDGNYVILDYWNVGLPIGKFNKVLYISRLSDVIGSSW